MKRSIHGWRLAGRAPPALAVAAVAILAGAGAALAQSGPPEVTVARPLVRELAEWMEFTGQFVAVDHVDVQARVTGYLNEVHFRDGQSVGKGDLLYTVDPRPFRTTTRPPARPRPRRRWTSPPCSWRARSA